MDWPGGIAVFLVGILCGFINTLAGGGSLLSLPLLIFLGLPAAVANGTNRLAILVQSSVAVTGFHRSGNLPWREALILSVPSVAGAWFGAGLAIEMDETAFRRVLAAILVLSVFLLMRKPTPSTRKRSVGFLVPVFLGIGIYGGFLQAGVGILILLATTGLAGMDLVKGNGIKTLTVTLYTIPVMARFVHEGQIVWSYAVVLALGNMLGAVGGVRLAVTRGHQWIRYILAASILVMAVALWMDS